MKKRLGMIGRGTLSIFPTCTLPLLLFYLLDIFCILQSRVSSRAMAEMTLDHSYPNIGGGAR